MLCKHAIRDSNNNQLRDSDGFLVNWKPDGFLYKRCYINDCIHKHDSDYYYGSVICNFYENKLVCYNQYCRKFHKIEDVRERYFSLKNYSSQRLMNFLETFTPEQFRITFSLNEQKELYRDYKLKKIYKPIDDYAPSSLIIIKNPATSTAAAPTAAALTAAAPTADAPTAAAPTVAAPTAAATTAAAPSAAATTADKPTAAVPTAATPTAAKPTAAASFAVPEDRSLDFNILINICNQQKLLITNLMSRLESQQIISNLNPFDQQQSFQSQSFQPQPQSFTPQPFNINSLIQLPKLPPPPPGYIPENSFISDAAKRIIMAGIRPREFSSNSESIPTRVSRTRSRSRERK